MLRSQYADFYNQNGYLIPDFRFSGDELERLQAGVQRVVDDNPNLYNMPITMAHIPTRPSHGVVSDGSLMEFAIHPKVLDVIEAVLGPDMILWQTSIYDKPKIIGNPTPWHQDGEYWPIRPLANTTAWIAATDCTKETACLRVIPGSHRAKTLLGHSEDFKKGLIFDRKLPADCFDEASAVDIELEAGQMVLFDVYTIHGSSPNAGTRARTAFAARYMPTTSAYLHDLPGVARLDKADLPEQFRNFYSKVPLYLVRGANRCEQNDLRRNH